MHEISSYRGNRPTNTHTQHTHTHKHTNPQTGPITIHCAAKLSAQCKYCSIVTRPRSETRIRRQAVSVCVLSLFPHVNSKMNEDAAAGRYCTQELWYGESLCPRTRRMGALCTDYRYLSVRLSVRPTPHPMSSTEGRCKLKIGRREEKRRDP